MLTNNGQIYTCGRGNYGQLGLGNHNNKNIPTLIPNLNINEL